MPLPSDVEDYVFLDVGSYPYRLTSPVLEDWVFLDDGQVHFFNAAEGGQRACSFLLLGAGS